METFAALLAICTGNSPVLGEFPAQWPVTRSFNVFFDLRLNKRLSKQSWGWWFETLSRPLWRHCNDTHGAMQAYIKSMSPGRCGSNLPITNIYEDIKSWFLQHFQYFCKYTSTPGKVCTCVFNMLFRIYVKTPKLRDINQLKFYWLYKTFMSLPIKFLGVDHDTLLIS